MTDTDVASAVPAGTAQAPSRTRRRAWIVTALLVVFMMINFADKSVLGLAAEEIRQDLGLSASAFGLANSAFFLLFSISGAAVGLLADRVRPKWLLLIMAVLWSVSQAPLAVGGGLAVLIASRVLLGAAEGPAYPVAQQTTLSWFPNHRRNLPGALIALGVTLGVLVAAPVLTWLISHHGWRSAVAAVALTGVVWTLLWIPFGGEGPYATTSENDSPSEAASDDGPGTNKGTEAETGAASAGQAQPKMPYRRILVTRTWIGVTIGYFSTYWVIAFALVWLPSYLRDGLGYSSAVSTQLLMLFWGLSGILVLGQAGLTGWMLRRGIASRWARGGVGGALLLIAGVSCLALPVAPGGAVTVVLLVGAFGLAGAMASIAATTIMELAPANRRGGALGIMNAVVTTAGLIAPTLIGSLVDTRGSGGYEYAVLITGALLLVGGIAAVTLINPDRDARLLSV
ncbi:MFS transporter [Streptomyces sp. NPDC048357]|uniref:MFS transporter n=1 Tax=Streptomyces sp. NPDC048357 TaxID=3154719 RepID=UPI00342779B0